jgi:hypothetical protein
LEDEYQSCSGEKSGAEEREAKQGKDPSGAKALVDFAQSTARLKSRPGTKP